MYLVLGPDSATRNGAGGVDGHVEPSIDGGANIEGKRDVVSTDTSGEGPGRSEIANVIVFKCGIAAGKLGDGAGKASGRVVQNFVNCERGGEAPRCSWNGSDETLGGQRHCDAS